VIRYALMVLAIAMLVACDRNPQADRPGGFRPTHRTLYVVNGLSETLSAIDLEDGTVYNDFVTVGKWPNDIVYDPDEGGLYIVESGDNQVTEISVDGGEVLRSMDVGVGENPWACAVDGFELWVSNFLTGELTLIGLESGEVYQRLQIGATLQALLIDGDNIYVTDTNYQYGIFGRGRIYKIDRVSRTETGFAYVGTNPQDIIVDGSGRLHVLCTGAYSGNGGGEIHVIDPFGMVPLDTLSLGGSPSAMCLGGDGTVYVAGYWGGVMTYGEEGLDIRHDASSPLYPGDGYMDIVFDPVTGLLYLTEFDKDQVVSLDPSAGRITATYGVGDGPLRMQIVEP